MWSSHKNGDISLFTKDIFNVFYSKYHFPATKLLLENLQTLQINYYGFVKNRFVIKYVMHNRWNKI